MKTGPKIPEIPDHERTPLVTALLEVIEVLREQLQAQSDEIARLKGEKPRPSIKPSVLEKNSGDKRDEENKEKGAKRPGSAKRSKTGELKIHDTVIVPAENVPEGSTFKGYEDFTVQGLLVQPHNRLYRRERWQTPQGDSVVAPLPEEVRAFGDFDPSLQRFVLYQYHHCHVTQPLILEELWELGIDISSGQVNRIITEAKERFHKEKDEILRVGLEVSDYVNVDDTGARHQGKNGYCTHIGNEMFAWFESSKSKSKSRLNFLGILRAGNKDYVLHALCWIHAERSINKLVGFNDAQREALAEVRTRIWGFYRDLKAYKQAPDMEHKAVLQERFDQIFTSRTCYATLNQALNRIYKNKPELLLVLERPEIPLHNNASETDIREYVKKRKISGSTRSDLGRLCRDTFASLKKTCRKLGIGFRDYLKDRVSQHNSISWLPDLMRLRVLESPG